MQTFIIKQVHIQSINVREKKHVTKGIQRIKDMALVFHACTAENYHSPKVEK